MIFPRLPTSLFAVFFIALTGCGDTTGTQTPEPAATPDPEPAKIRAVVVTMFEIGEDSGDQAGEFQLWNERRDLTEVYEFGGHHTLHHDPESGLLVMVTGIGTAKSAASVMMLGMDPRFDVSRVPGGWRSLP